MGNRIGSGWSNNAGAMVDGHSALGQNTFAPMRWNIVGSDYFHTLGTPVPLGRDFNGVDAETAPRVAIVNQTFANNNKYLGGLPAMFAVALAGIAVVSLLASLIPALRAASVDPMVALRDE